MIFSMTSSTVHIAILYTLLALDSVGNGVGLSSMYIIGVIMRITVEFPAGKYRVRKVCPVSTGLVDVLYLCIYMPIVLQHVPPCME